MGWRAKARLTMRWAACLDNPHIIRGRSIHDVRRPQAGKLNNLDAARIGDGFEARGFFARILEDRLDARDAAAQFGFADDQWFVDARCFWPRFAIKPEICQRIRRGEQDPQHAGGDPFCGGQHIDQPVRNLRADAQIGFHVRNINAHERADEAPRQKAFAAGRIGLCHAQRMRPERPKANCAGCSGLFSGV